MQAVRLGPGDPDGCLSTKAQTVNPPGGHYGMTFQKIALLKSVFGKTA